MKTKAPIIGFVGQGWIGRNYANDFEKRRFKTVRYGLEEQYKDNKEKIRECDITFIAVPTPTTPKGFDASIVESALPLIGKGKIAVIKSTILPGTTKRFQEKYPDIVLLYSPEFLSESTAQYDVEHPFSNIVGVPVETKKHRAAAELVLSILPPSPSTLISTSTEAEIIKYSHNASGYVQIILFNLIFDLAKELNCDWSVIQRAVELDPMICNRYANPVHKSGRGAGGGCFIKDIVALRELYERLIPKDRKGAEVFHTLEAKNIDLLLGSGKDEKLLKGVYGEDISL
ncbi:MAG TPA: hypothetical protein VJH94_01735 [Candidatus Paceibacterota bacterium]